MSEKRFYYNIFYFSDDCDGIKEFEIRDRENDEWAIYIGENDSNWEDMLVELLNEQQATINNFEKLFSETIGVADTSKLLETGDYEIKRMFVRELIENLRKENEQLQKKIRVLSAHLLSDECCLTDSQIRKIRKELEE